MGDIFYYEEIPEWYVSASKRDMAAKALAFCVADLGLQPLIIAWAVLRGSSQQCVGRKFLNIEEVNGSAILPENIVMINAEPPYPFNLSNIVAHECRHFHQYKIFTHSMFYRLYNLKHWKVKMEKDAGIYADQALQAMYYHNNGVEYSTVKEFSF